jgi:hypothetical protein
MGIFFLHGLACHVLIRIEILTISAFKLCMNCLRLAAPELFFIGSKLTTPFVILVIKDSGAYLQKAFDLEIVSFFSRFKSD